MVNKGEEYFKKRNKVEIKVISVDNNIVSFHEIGYMNIKEMETEDFLELFTKKPSSFILVKETPDGGGVRNHREELVLAKTKKKLEIYCKVTLQVELGKPKNFSWDPFYTIEPSNIILL